MFSKMNQRVTAYLSIGSNKGNTLKNLHQAIQELNEMTRLQVTAVSGFYKTAPQNFEDQEWFVNAAIEIQTDLAPEDLLKVLKGIENKLDQKGKAFRFGPRIIDLDIVLYGKTIYESRDLIIPHPRMHERSFVLIPLCDIDPALVHPLKNKTIKYLSDKLKTTENQEVLPLVQEEANEIFH